MKLKQYCRFQVDFKSKWIEACPLFMGLGFFATLVYYFAVTTLRDVPIIEAIAAILSGVLATAAFVVCMKCLFLNAPGLYAIFGAIQCVAIILIDIANGGAAQIVLSIIWYLLAGAVLVLTAGGYLPGRLLAGLMFLIPIPVRILFFDLGKLGLLQWVRELSVLLILAGIGCMAMGLTRITRGRE
ncbi:MAG: hypothetical protein E7470_06855 [Ruminococcaceae bacterium]|nr:hypothetical protein [Oscillospiraceae bacterium]